jgi:hypothetical protein
MPLMYTWKPIEEIKHRMEPAFWHPRYTEMLQELQSSSFILEKLGKFVTHITYGSTKRAEYRDKGVIYIKAIDIATTGIIYPNLQFIEKNCHVDTPRSRLEVNDLMVVRSGKGSIGKIAIWHKDMGVANASQHVDLVRTQGINPYWIAAFLKSKYGQIQIEQLETGVSRMTHLTYDDIRRFIIPVVSDTIQQSTQRRYLQMLQFHDAAMEAKVSGDESEYREKLTYAEKLLTELIEYVENTIYMGPQAETSVQEQP